MNRIYLVLFILSICIKNSYATLYNFRLQKMEDPDSLFLEKVKQADSLLITENPEAAIMLLKKYRHLPSFSSSSCSTKGRFYHEIGRYHYQLYKDQEALKYFRDSTLAIRLSCLGPKHQETGKTYFAIAATYRALGKRKKQSEYLSKSLEIFENLPEKDMEDLAYKYLTAGILYDELGDFEQAENYLLHAQQYYKNLEIKSNDEVGELQKSFGILKRHQLIYPEAIKYSLSAIETFECLGKKKYEKDIADCHLNLGTAYMHQGNHVLAKKSAFLALEGYQKKARDLDVSNSYELLGNIERNQKNYDKALRYINQSLRLRMKGSSRKKISNAYENIADIIAEQKKYEQALKNYDLSIFYLLPNFKKGVNQEAASLEYELVVDHLDLLRVLSFKATTLLTRFKAIGNEADLTKAYSLYQQLDKLIVKIRQQYKASGSKFFLAQRALPIYEKAIETALILFKNTSLEQYLEEAYIYSAKNKAIVLLDGLQDSNAKFVGIPEHILEKEKNLKEKYAELEKEIFMSTSKEVPDSLLESNQLRLSEIRRSLEKLVTQLENEYPNYYALKYAIPDLSTIKTLQDSLSADQALIEYFVGVQKIFVFTILKNKIHYNAIEKPIDFDKNCEDFRKLSSGLRSFNPIAFRSTANALYNLLLKNSLSNLTEKVTRLIIIPDDYLLQFSFDNLFYEEAKEGTPFPYLIKKYAISTPYSNQLLFKSDLLKNKKQPNKLFGGFGLEYNNFTLQGLENFRNIRNSINDNGQLGKLFYSDDEVQEVADLLNGKAWLNEDATKSNFLKHAGNYKILHLAMHGLIDKETPLNSSLIFFRASDSTDYVLRASDLYRIELNTDLVVLSACHTGTGKISKGEGVRSLARAFAYAGSPALVASLWSASDYSTKEILVPFYKNLHQGMPKDVALQQAKLEYLAKASPTNSYPALWSHLTVVGNTESIVFDLSGKSRFPWRMIGLILLALFFTSKLRPKKS